MNLTLIKTYTVDNIFDYKLDYFLICGDSWCYDPWCCKIVKSEYGDANTRALIGLGDDLVPGGCQNHVQRQWYIMRETQMKDMQHISSKD